MVYLAQMTPEVKVSIHYPSEKGGKIEKNVIFAETPVHIFVEEINTGINKHSKISTEIKPIPGVLLNTLASRVLGNLGMKFPNIVQVSEGDYDEISEDGKIDVLASDLWDPELDPEDVVGVIMKTGMLTNLEGDKRMLAQIKKEVREVVYFVHQEVIDSRNVS